MENVKVKPSSRHRLSLSRPLTFLSSSAFSLPIRTHACGLLRVICQIWRGSPGCHRGGGGRCLHPFRRPASPPTLHLSPLLRTRAIQRPFLTFELWECSLAALAAVKETHPCLSRFTPVLPVALLLWCCAPAPLVSAVGSCPGSNLSTWPSPNQSSCVITS